MNEQTQEINEAPKVSKLKQNEKVVKSLVDIKPHNRKDRRKVGLRSYSFNRRALHGKSDMKYMKRQFAASLAYEQHKQALAAEINQIKENLEKELKAEADKQQVVESDDQGQI